MVYYVKVNDKVNVISNGYGYYPGYYGLGYGSSFYGAGGLDVYEYKEGTIVLDFVDFKSKELIWRGLYSGEIDRSGIISEKKINKAVKEILKQFPPENRKTSKTVG